MTSMERRWRNTDFCKIDRKREQKYNQYHSLDHGQKLEKLV